MHEIRNDEIKFKWMNDGMMKRRRGAGMRGGRLDGGGDVGDECGWD